MELILKYETELVDIKQYHSVMEYVKIKRKSIIRRMI